MADEIPTEKRRRRVWMMRLSRAWRAGIAAAVMLLALLPANRANAAAITSASLVHQGAVSELHFTLTGNAPRLKLTAHGGQLWIDLDRSDLAIAAHPLLGREGGVIRSVSALSPASHHARIIVEVNGKADYVVAQRSNEIILRIAPKGQAANLAAPLLARPRNSTPSYPATASRAMPHDALPAQTTALSRTDTALVRPPPPQISSDVAHPLAGNPLVMVDPGHGGFDPGTKSLSGILEKDLALSISRRVVSALKARGVRAQLTRDSDEFISLAQRTQRANAADADLFVSIHLNWSPDSQTTGIEAYYLNNTTDRATIRLARMENAAGDGASAPRDGDLNYILADLRQNYKATEAASLARMIDAQTVADLDSQLGLQVNALGAKKGPFYVLVGAHMPAVLIECGFLSNPYEAARLSSAQYQETLAQGIAAAVVHYLSSDAAVGDL
jgi:N-acetylmuramoyl-L-alanine amidase